MVQSDIEQKCIAKKNSQGGGNEGARKIQKHDSSTSSKENRECVHQVGGIKQEKNWSMVFGNKEMRSPLGQPRQVEN